MNIEVPDWQKGSESKTNYNIRIMEMNDWLKNNNKEIRIKIEEKNKIEEQPVGFVDL